MILYGDYHIHSVYSHGKGSILDNATVAAKKGLRQIAITDHGFEHEFFGVNRKNINKIKEDIIMASEVTGVEILFGVEANLTSLDGTIDIKEEDYEFLDLLVVGHHRFVSAKTMRDKFKLFYANMLPGIFKPSQERINRNTTAFLKALDKYPIDVIAHIGEGMPIDKITVAKLAKQKGTFIELNAKHMTISDDELLEMAACGVKFIINSDAHRPERVGECNGPINSVIRTNIPTSQVVNLDKLPKFQRKRG